MHDIERSGEAVDPDDRRSRMLVFDDNDLDRVTARTPERLSSICRERAKGGSTRRHVDAQDDLGRKVPM